MAEFTIDVVESAPYAQMAYVLWRPGRTDALVVDPGFDSRTILELLEHDGKTPAAILNTHGHVDHIAGNAALKAAHPAAPLIIGRGDAPMLTDRVKNLSSPAGEPVVSPPADRLVDDGDRLELAGFSILVREIPGHSPGSVVYILDEEEPAAVLGGDVLFAGSIGRVDFGGDPKRDFEVLMSGITAKLLSLPDETRVYPGHGGVTTIGSERRTNPFVRDYLARTGPQGRMTVWAVSDLHLSLARPDRRDRFGARWSDHVAKLEAGWRAAVRPEDLVLIPGDVSMARNHRELQPDLRWLEAMPGRKVLSPGNHDAWWNDLAKIRPMLRPSLRAVEGTAEVVDGLVVAGARSMAVPRVDDPGAPVDDKAVERALAGLEAALEAASALRKGPEQPLVLLWHFPPFDAYNRPGPWVERFEQFGVTACLYGHLHIQSQWSRAVQGPRGNVRYQCVAADAVGFRPIRVAGL